MPSAAVVPYYASVLALHRLVAEVRLGVGEEERRLAQKVVIDIRLYFPSVPPAGDDDNADYICYHTLSEKIKELCLQKEYRLLEHLTHSIHHLLREALPKEVAVGIKLRKPEIMLPYVKEGASYAFTDLPPGAWVPPELP